MPFFLLKIRIIAFLKFEIEMELFAFEKNSGIFLFFIFKTEIS